MLISMTGFGKATCELENKKLTIEIKSLNSKQLDINSRIPGFYREKEIAVRNLISKKLVRGKVDFSMYAEVSGTENNSIVNTEIVKAYYNQLTKISSDLGINNPADMLSIIMRLPDTLKTEREELDEDEWKVVMQSIESALNDLISYRSDEGIALEKDITERVKSIQDLLQQVEPLEIQRIEKVKERLRANLKELSEKDDIDQNRFEQELIFYLEKLDITEEKVRLANHCEYFLTTMAMDEPVGKKLGFISQEIGREINTLGSKANDSDLQKVVVIMKDELEKIKEQMLNIL
ncbi:MAG: YicC family protein [Salinivirgaceae bacterium]|nr:YicC family protein [Salinivirgaceae bacterium]